MPVVRQLSNNLYEVNSVKFDNLTDAYSYMRYVQDLEERNLIQAQYTREMLDQWGNTLDEEATHSTGTMRRGRGSMDRNTRELRELQKQQEKEKRQAELDARLANELRLAKNLKKGIDDWGEVYSQDRNRWYQKDVETKLAVGKAELATMVKHLNKNGIDISDELPAYVPPVELSKSKVNGSRKIFILDEE